MGVLFGGISNEGLEIVFKEYLLNSNDVNGNALFDGMDGDYE